MPSRKKAKYFALYIYTNNNDLRDTLKSLKDVTGLTYCKLMRRMIEEVSANERLAAAVQSYYLQNNSAWVDNNDRTTIRISLDQETLDLASSLAFRICGTGSISEVGRVIVRYYADHAANVALFSRLAEAPKKTIGAAAPAMVVPFVTIPVKRQRRKMQSSHPKDKVEYKKTVYNLDIESVDLLGQMVTKMRLKYLALVSLLIEQYNADKTRFQTLLNSNVLLEDPPHATELVAKRFNFTEEIDGLLDYLCENIPVSDNRSALIRALIKVEAELQGLRGRRPRGTTRFYRVKRSA
jgi:hypothetical protein